MEKKKVLKLDGILVAEQSPPGARELDPTADIRRAVSEGFGEYRRKIGEIRQRYGWSARRSLRSRHS